MKEPLANKMRPQSIKDIVGQTHLLHEYAIIPRMIFQKHAFSCIFYGKPGIGKTTLAIALAKDLKIPFQIFNAANDNKEKLSEIIDLAKLSSSYIIIVEEIHRLNRDRQDLLLHSLEKGKIILFATTTENPFFVINPAIRSRCQIFQLKPLTCDEVLSGLKIIIKKFNIKNISNSILKIIANKTQGDYRSAINILDLLIALYPDIHQINETILTNVMNESYVSNSHYDDEFHNLKSALHKSIRGSNVDASLHYLGRMIISQDLISISRRLLMVAYEDIGLANPNLCMRVYTGIQAAKEVGFPEASTILANLVIELALSPKSNSSAIAINKAMTDIATGQVFEIPKHLQDNHYKSSIKLGIKGYKYPHDYPNAWVEQEYLPKELKNKVYYEPPIHSQNESKLISWFKNLNRFKEN